VLAVAYKDVGKEEKEEIDQILNFDPLGGEDWGFPPGEPVEHTHLNHGTPHRPQPIGPQLSRTTWW